VALKNLVQKLTRSIEDLDREDLVRFCDAHGFAPLDVIDVRSRVATGGEVSSCRIVPRAGADALEVTFTDGRGFATAVFLGRRKIAGLHPGKRIAVEGVVASNGRQRILFNPVWSFVG
jgi:hypothetical protein